MQFIKKIEDYLPIVIAVSIPIIAMSILIIAVRLVVTSETPLWHDRIITSVTLASVVTLATIGTIVIKYLAEIYGPLSIGIGNNPPSEHSQFVKKIVDHLPVVIAVSILIIAVSLMMALKVEPKWYYGVIMFFALGAIGTIVIEYWCKIYPWFSIRNHEKDHAQMNQQLFKNKLDSVKMLLADNDSKKPSYWKSVIDFCETQLRVVTEEISKEGCNFSLAWNRLHSVEEMLLLLYSPEEVIAQRETIAARVSGIPREARRGKQAARDGSKAPRGEAVGEAVIVW